MSNCAKRKLRNTNACPTVMNMFYDQLTTQNLLPKPIAAKLNSNLNLNCLLVESLPTFINQDSVDQALQLMKKATEWQNSFIYEEKTKSTIPAEKQEPIRENDNEIKNQIKMDLFKVEAEPSMHEAPERIYQDLGINRFAPATYDYDYSNFHFEPRPAIPLSDWQHNQIHFF